MQMLEPQPGPTEPKAGRAEARNLYLNKFSGCSDAHSSWRAASLDVEIRSTCSRGASLILGIHCPTLDARAIKGQLGPGTALKAASVAQG